MRYGQSDVLRFPELIGLVVEDVRVDYCRMRLPWRAEIAQPFGVAHGGAIATLVDTAGMVAAWSDDVEPESPAGGTISMSVEYVAAARGCDLRARAEVVRRARELCFVEVTVLDEARGHVVAKGLVTHRYG